MSAKSSPEVVTIKKLHSLALTATKTELYKKLVELDRDCIRKREHIRNALTCTGPLQEIEKELNRVSAPRVLLNCDIQKFAMSTAHPFFEVSL